MHWQYNPYAVPLVIVALMSAALVTYAWRRRATPGAGPLVLLMLAVVVWSLGYVLGLSSTALPSKVFWAKVQYPGIVAVPLMWLVLVIQYTGQEKWLTQRNLTLLAIIPLVTLLLAWTNDAHGLIWSRVSLYSSGSLSMVEFTHGPAFWVYWGYSQLLMVVSAVLLLRSLVHSQRIYRGQVCAMLVGALAPWAGNAMYLSGLNPFPGLDLTPFAFALTGIAAAWAVFQHRLLDIVPIARDAVIESMSDGVVVLDTQGRIVDLNPIAQQILGRSASDTIGAPASQVLPDGLDDTGPYDNSTITHNEIVLGEGETQCRYDMRTSPLYNKRNRITGSLVILRDITERKLVEDKLQSERAQLLSIFDSINEIIYVADPKTYEILYANKALTDAFRKSLVGGICYRELQGLESPCDFCTNEIILRDKGNPWRWEYHNSILDRDYMIVDKIIEWPDGRDVRFELAIDITERKQAEEALQRERDFAESLIETAQTIVLVLDIEGRIVRFNRYMEEISGYSLAEVQGKDWFSTFLPEKDQRCIQKLFSKAIGDIPTRGNVNTIVTKDGHERMIEWSDKTLKDAEGNVVGLMSIGQDITDRLLAEKDLRSIKEFNEGIVRTVAEALLIEDTEGIITFVNPAMEEMVGYTANELVGGHWRKIVSQEKLEIVQAKTSQRPSGVSDQYETRLRGKDGREIPMLVSTRPLFEEGTFTGVLSAFSDISERVQAEDLLRIQRDLGMVLSSVSNLTEAFDQLLQAALQVDGIDCGGAYVVDEVTGGLDLVVHQGLPPQFVESACHYDADSPNTRLVMAEEPIFRRYSEVLPDTKGEPRTREGLRSTAILPVKHEGRVVAVLNLASHTHDQIPSSARNALHATVAQMNSVIARLEAEEALQESEERFRAQYESIPLPTYTWQRVGEQFILVGYNEAATAAMRGKIPERLGMTAAERYKDRPELLTELLRCYTERTRIHTEMPYRSRSTGEDKYYSAWHSFVPPDLVMIHTEDITERVRAEEQLQHYATELKHANEEVKNFAYIVSHDLRAPLVNLKGFAAELRSSLSVIDPAMNSVLSHLDEVQRQEVTLALQEDIPEALEFIESSVTRMDHFISAVLKLSRVGRRELRPEPVGMNALVHEALQTVSHQLDKHHSKVTVEPLPDVVADRTSLEQIIGNILGNAVKYLDGDRPGEITITAERDGDETTFHIRDNGRGISEADMPKVFAPFRRAGKQDIPGEGMGLTYVQTLVRRHGGRIWCESELGVGTTFSFTISNDLEKGGDDA